jgi:hypothetical protein
VKRFGGQKKGTVLFLRKVERIGRHAAAKIERIGRHAAAKIEKTANRVSQMKTILT